jgi:hypothetical protein
MAMKIGRTLAVVSAFATLCLAFAPAAQAAPAHGWDHRCGSQPQAGAGWYNVRAYNLVCSEARRVARRYTYGQPGQPHGWRCDEKRIGDEVVRVDCIRRQRGEHQHVRFIVGA